MTTSPQRRNRIRQAHQLRQQGHTLREIAQHLDVSHSTIADDLALLETDRIQLTLNITHDLLLAHTLNLHDRLQYLLYRDPLKPLTRFSNISPDGKRITLDSESGPQHIARLEAIHDRATTNVLREFRLAVRELERATDRIKNQPTDYPLEQLAAPDHDRTNPTKPDHDPPLHDRTNPTKPDHDHPLHDRTNPTKPDHNQPSTTEQIRPNPTTTNPPDQIRTRPKQPVPSPPSRSPSNNSTPSSPPDHLNSKPSATSSNTPNASPPNSPLNSSNR